MPNVPLRDCQPRRPEPDGDTILHLRAVPAESRLRDSQPTGPMLKKTSVRRCRHRALVTIKEVRTTNTVSLIVRAARKPSELTARRTASTKMIQRMAARSRPQNYRLLFS